MIVSSHPSRALAALFFATLAVGCPAPDDDDATAADDDTTSAPDDDSTFDEVENPWGFHMRLPRSHELDCEGTPTPFADADWLCTWSWADSEGVVYIGATPTACVSLGMNPLPVFDAGGEIVIDGVVSTLQSAAYDWGGNHQNDSLDIDWAGHHFRWYHSSFGFGWRACGPMDCLQVSDVLGGPLLEDGCTCDRSLPMVCRAVQPDGSWEPLDDLFEVCNGDPECGL